MPGPLNRVFLVGEVAAIEDSPSVVRLTLNTVDHWTDREGSPRVKRQTFKIVVVHKASREFLTSGGVRVGDELLIEGQLESRAIDGQDALGIVLGGLHSTVQLLRRASDARW